MSAKSLKQQNKGLSKKSTKTNEIEDKNSDTNQSSQASAELSRKSTSVIEIDDDDQNGQSNLSENQDDNQPQVTKKVKTAEEEHSMSKINS